MSDPPSGLGFPGTAVVVFDDVDTAALGGPRDAAILLWAAVPDDNPDGRIFALPLIVDERQVALRAAYLAWLAGAASQPVAGTDVEAYLAVRPDLSYWWMALPAQFNFWVDSPVLTMVKLLALASVCDEQGFRSIVATGGTAPVREALARWCANSGRRLSFAASAEAAIETARLDPAVRSSTSSTRIGKGTVRSGARNVVETARALASTGRHAARDALAGRGRPRDLGSSVGSGNGTVLIDYASAAEVSSLEEGSFTSRYWGPLVGLVTRQPGTIWLHRRVTGVQWPAGRSGQTDDPITSGGSVHVDVTHVPARSHRLQGLREYATVARRAARVSRVPRLFVEPSSGLDAWPLVRKTWLQCFFGANGLASLTWLCAIEHDLSQIPQQRLGIFLLEDQPWELALMSAWRRAGHGSLVGFAHTTVRFWDLRYAVPGLSLARASTLCPVPDLIAVNGPPAREAMADFGVPADRLADVEAVRFLGEVGALTESAAGHSGTARPTTILVLGEYETKAVTRQLRQLHEATELCDARAVFTFRGHPAAEAIAMPSPRFTTCLPTASLAECLADCDAILVGETSSVVIEALAARKPLAIMADPDVLPTNPLRAHDAVAVVGTAVDLAAWLTGLESGAMDAAELRSPSEFFFLDPALPGWQATLALASQRDR